MVKVKKDGFVVIGKEGSTSDGEGFGKGLYLAGVECAGQAEAPDGWTKWTIPGYEYIVVENRHGAFEKTLGQMKEEGIPLAGAVHDYTDPATGKGYLYFPIREL